MAKDVLDVLIDYLNSKESCEMSQEMSSAIDKLSELIAADVELDAARQAWSESNEGEACDAHFESAEYRRVTVAEMRRAAALAACRGLA